MNRFFIIWSCVLFSLALLGEEIEADFAAAAAQDQATITEMALKPLSGGSMSENPDISFILDGGFAVFSRNDHLRQGGHSIDENGFTIQGVELAVSHAVDPFFRFDMNFQFVGMHIEEVYMTTLSLPFNLQMRAGMMNALFGRENNMHLHVLNFTNYSLMHSRFMSQEHFSGIGSELTVLLPFSWYSLVVTQVFDTKGTHWFRSATFGSAELTKSGRINGVEDFLYLVRWENFFDLSDALSLKTGVSSAFGQSPYVPDNRAALYGGDFYLKWRDVQSGNDAFAAALTGEFVVRDTQVPLDSVREIGGYLLFDLQADRFWLFSLRGDYTDLLIGNPSNIAKMPFQQLRGSVAATWMPTHFSKLRVQYDVTKEEEEDPFHAVFLQVEVAIGAHGAHSF